VLQQGPRSFFSEIISSINDIKFSPCGRYLLSRDYMTLKLWDINQDAAPLACYPVHESLRGKVRGQRRAAAGGLVVGLLGGTQRGVGKGWAAGWLRGWAADCNQLGVPGALTLHASCCICGKPSP
jgi:serine/threonine-protein phosphatase 2A regulatory subunit B